MTSRSTAHASLVLALATSAPQDEPLPYVKLATRAETEKAARAALTGIDVEYGPWRLLATFSLPEGSKGIARSLPFEEQLGRCGLDGPGPDFARAWLDEVRGEIRWRALGPAAELEPTPESAPRPVLEPAPDDASQPAQLTPEEWLEIKRAQGGDDGSEPIDLARLSSGDHVVAYLHREIRSERAARLRVQAGSDDGLRLWLNGELLVDAPSERGFWLDQHSFELPLGRGVNHVVAKVAQDAGGWMFQMTPDVRVARAAEVELEWRLDEDFPEGESAHWRLAPLAIPESAQLEAGGVDLMPDGRPIVCTRRGDVFVVDGAWDLPAIAPSLTLFASGLHEPLGIAVRPDRRGHGGVCVMLAQRGELTRLVDLDGDSRADLFETACDAWQVSGNYHEYAFGPAYDPDGNAWITLNLGHTGGDTVMGAGVATRGCAVLVRPDGRMEIAADGLRSPDGVGFLPGFGPAYTDNQGDYVATNKLALLLPGSFHGHQATLAHRGALAADEHGRARAVAVPDDWKPWRKGEPPPRVQAPAIWFPYGAMGQSAAGFVTDETGGRFGPFAGQIFVGDQTHASVMRVFLERVDGVVQGACFPFRSGLKSGAHRLRFAPDGSLLVGLTDRGWGSKGGWRDGLERVLYTGVEPFEMKAIRAVAAGFEVELTQEPDPARALDPARWRVSAFTYSYHPDYGSPQVDPGERVVSAVTATGPRRLLLAVADLRPGYVHEIRADGVLTSDGRPLLHPTAWYTMQQLPAGATPAGPGATGSSR